MDIQLETKWQDRHLHQRIVREEDFEGKSAFVVRNGNNEDYYAKETLGMFARKTAGKVVFKRSDSRVNFLWPLEQGKEWTSAYIRENVQIKTSESFSYKMVVAGRESVTVPAGTFDTFKVQVFISANFLPSTGIARRFERR